MDKINVQMGLPGFTTPRAEMQREDNAPLAFKLRPTSFDGFVGAQKLLKKYYFLKNNIIPSMVIWGPPGSGKTTLAHILASKSDSEIYHFNAVMGGVNDLKKIIQEALEFKAQNQRDIIIFIDEIHRFNKAQQDALLPYLEKGSFKLIGATTENPMRAINKALLSRVQTVKLDALGFDDISSLIDSASEKLDNFNISPELRSFISDHSGGDSRKALNFLEQVYQNPEASIEDHQQLILESSRSYDANKDRHYDVISAFIKSMRGSDPDAALLWLAVMLDGGEDPFFIARRLVIFASEDIGNADPQALTVASSTLNAVQNIGMPEAGINLAQAVTYLSSTHKSNASYSAYKQALAYVKERPTIEVPDHLKNFPPKQAKSYLYPHDYENNYVDQDYSLEESLDFYHPQMLGFEQNFLKRLNGLRGKNT